MNYKMILSTIGRMLMVLSGLLMLPLIVAIIYGESTIIPIIISAVVPFILGLALYLAFKTKNHIIYAKEGFAIVALVWILFSVFGAFPFVLSREIPSFVDALFETVSGFTTTGSSILTDIEAMSKSLLFWRSFTHWVGGMGVLVFVMALIPNISDRSIHLLRAEVPGPIVGKVVPRIKDSARILYIIYMVLTLVEIIMLFVGGMPFFDSVVHSFGTAGTGGFGTKADSIGGYNPACQWIITIFMMLSGVNFSLYYMLLLRQFSRIWKSEELKWYWVIFAVASIVIAINILPMYGSFEEAIRLGAFQVASIMTTTGFATADFNLWPELSRTILVLLMFVGASAGSTGGGLKVSRIMIMVKSTFREMRRLTHPRSVSLIKLDKKPLDQEVINGVHIYFLAYMLIMALSMLLVSVDGFDFTTTVTSVIACFNNIGPGLEVVGPMGNFSEFSWFSKIVLSFDMLFGRLEIYPMIITMSVSTWKRKKKNNDKNENSLS